MPPALVGFLRASFGGLLFGSMAAAVWALVWHFIGIEWGWIAWGVGVAVAFGVRMGAGERTGVGYGLLASVLAVVSLLAAKSVPVFDDFVKSQKEFDANPPRALTAEDVLVHYADAVSVEWATHPGAGPKVLHVPHPKQPQRFHNSHLPAVNAEAERRWDALSEADQSREIAALQARAAPRRPELTAGTLLGGLFAHGSCFDPLWVVLAVGSAFGLGSGLPSKRC